MVLERMTRRGVCCVLALLGLLHAAWCDSFLLFAQESPQEKVIVHFRAAQRATREGRFEYAVEEYEKVLHLAPQLVEARVNLGLAHYMLGRYELAVGELEKCVRERPDLLGANIFLGISLLKLGLSAKAIPPLKRALRLDPSNREGRRALASSYLARNDYRKAASQFQTVFSFETDKSEAWYHLGSDYLRMAQRLVDRVSEMNPGSAWGDRLGADFLFDRGLWNDATVEYRKALGRDPKQPGLHLHLGNAYLHQKQLGEAEAEFLKELELYPHDEQALLGLAGVQLARGLPMAALETISKLWEIFPPFLILQPDFPAFELPSGFAGKLATQIRESRETAAHHFLLWILYRASEENEMANGHFQSLTTYVNALHQPGAGRPRETHEEICRLRRYPACAEEIKQQIQLGGSIELLLGKTLLALGNYEQAADAFASALNPQSENLEATYRLVRTYQGLAQQCFVELEKLFPDSWRLHQLRGEAHRLREAEGEAIKEYRQAVRLKPDEAELHEALGDLYLSNSRYQEARTELGKALDLDPTRAQTLFLMGRLHLLRRETENAVLFLKKALQYDPSLLNARASLGTAYVRLGQAALAVPQLEKAVGMDHYGNLHFLLYRAHLMLGNKELAQRNLERSQELRRQSLEIDRRKITEAPKTE